jgi:predicted TIM-barrel fold metal-dependent hydrolase
MIPPDIGIVDLLIGFPAADPDSRYEFLKPLLQTASGGSHSPVEYMFKDAPDRLDENQDPIDVTIAEMDHHGIEMGLVLIGPSVGPGDEVAKRAIRERPKRFAGCLEIDPNHVTATVRSIRDAFAEYRIKAVSSFPAGCNPPVPISDRRYYPIYQTCIDLDIPIVLNTGIAGPLVTSDCQHVMHLDQICYDFPELRVVMRHGAEPWEELAVKLMLKWPGLYYMTSGFAPKYYPRAIIEFANTRGADKIMYAGYFPTGLTLDRIFSELPTVGFRDHVWKKFLRDNAVLVFKLLDV